MTKNLAIRFGNTELTIVPLGDMFLVCGAKGDGDSWSKEWGLGYYNRTQMSEKLPGVNLD